MAVSLKGATRSALLAAALAATQPSADLAAAGNAGTPKPIVMAAHGDALSPLRSGPAVQLWPTKQPRTLITPAVVRSAPSPDAPVLATLPMGAVIEVDGRTADAAFLRVAAPAAIEGETRTGWIWAPLARAERPPVDPNAAAPGAAMPRAAGPAATPASERTRQLKRYRRHFHAALVRHGLDPLSDDTAAAIGLFRDIVGRVRSDFVRPVDLGRLIDDAIDGLAGSADRPGRTSASPRELMLASLRHALARLDGASTILTPAELAASGGSVEDRTRDRGGRDGADGSLPNDAGYRTPVLQVTGFPKGMAALVEGIISRDLSDAGAALPPIGAVVLDLRGNGGGLLEEAVAFADLFLPTVEVGRTITRRGRDYHFAIGDDLLEGVPMVVLVDEGTGAGAELVAGALQASGRALLAGNGTQGAAAAQMIMPLADDQGALRLTTGRLTLADGLEFGCRGLAPDVRLDAPARHAAVADVPGRAGCADPGITPIRLLPRESCPVPGGEAIEGEVACLIYALRTFVLAARSGR